MHVFLSYSRRDAAFVGRLADDLAARGIDPWLDTEDLPTDDEDRWRRAIVQGIRESGAFVLVLSPDSVHSAAVEREVTIAAELRRRIIPIVHRPCTLSDGLIFELAGVQRIDFVDQPYEAALAQLLERIGTRAEASVEFEPPAVAGLGGPPGPPPAGAAAGPSGASGGHTAAQRAGGADGPVARRGGWLTVVVAVVGSLVAILVTLGAIGLLAGDDPDGTDAGRAASTGPADVAGGPDATAPGAPGPSTGVPGDEATATLERRDGTSAVVRAATVGIGCGTGSFELANGQTVSLELVASIRFDAVHLDEATADGVVTLRDGRQLTEPIRTRNCPISGTTDLGPLAIPIEEIRRIDFAR